jgi:hypothetical protein
MAIDPSIALGVRAPSINTPFENLSQLMQVRQQQQQVQSAQALEEERRRTLAEKQKTDAERDAVSKIIGNPNLTRESVLEAVRTTVPSQYEAMVKLYDDHDKAVSEIKTKGLEAQKAQADLLEKKTGYFSGLAAAVKANKYDPVAFELALQHAEQAFPDLKPQTDQYRQAVLQQGPHAIQAVIDGLIAQTPTIAKDVRETADSALTAPSRTPNAQGLTPAQQASASAAQVTGAAATLNAQTNAARERRETAAAAPFLAAPGSATGPTPTLPPGQRNEEFLTKLPTATADKVKALVEGRLALPQRFAKGDTYWQSLLDAAVKYDPTFDAANYNARNKARTDLTSPSGTGGKTINALNTALQHAGKLSDLIEKLDNYSSPIENALVNPIRTATGATAVTNFQAVAPQLMKEIERAWRGTGGSSADIQELIDSIGKNLGKQQQREALHQFVELVKGKLDSTQQQRDNILGPIAGAQVPVLFEQNKPVIDTITQRASGEAPAPKTGRVRVKGPNGQSGTVPEDSALPPGWTKVP